MTPGPFLPANYGVEHIERVSVDITDDVMVMRLYNRETREGYAFQMTVTDCYTSTFVKHPLFGGAPRWVRYIDDGKVNLKLRDFLGRDLRDIGWIPA